MPFGAATRSCRRVCGLLAITSVTADWCGPPTNPRSESLPIAKTSLLIPTTAALPSKCSGRCLSSGHAPRPIIQILSSCRKIPWRKNARESPMLWEDSLMQILEIRPESLDPYRGDAGETGMCRNLLYLRVLGCSQTALIAAVQSCAVCCILVYPLMERQQRLTTTW